MRDTDDPEFLAHLRAENDYAEAWFGPHESTIDAIYGEIRSRVQETDLSTPVTHGGWWYVTSTVEGLDYPIHHRGPTRDEAARDVVLDQNVEAAGHEYFDLGAFDASCDHRLLAWSSDTAGDERYTLRIRDLGAEGGPVDLPTRIDDTSNAGVAWSRDNGTIFYVTPDEQERPSKVWRHTIGADPATDVCVFEERDERFFVAVGATRSDEWIVIHSASKTTTEVLLIPTDDPAAMPRPTLGRTDEVDYSLDHWGDRFVALTNHEALDFRILVAPVSADLTVDSSWVELVAHSPGRRIVGLDAFERHLVVSEWADGQPRLRILFRDGGERTIDGPHGDEPHDIDAAANPEWTTEVLRYAAQSMTEPTSIFDEHTVTAERELLRRVPTPNTDTAQYTAERRWAESPDGTLVPIDIVRHVDTPTDGTAPGVLYGYGAYEISLPPWYSAARLSLLDRGVVFAVAHPRGGGELGRQWYLDGKLLAKPNTFDDTIACAEHLVAGGHVAAGRLCIRGGSAGGLLVGACITKRPDLFASAVAEVPFVDVVSTMSDPSLPLTVTEWEEWGDPREQPYASCIEGYSPYDNTVAASYPALYVTAGLTDPRVSVHEPAKWVAKLRDVGTGDRPLLLRTEMEAGHGGPTGRYEAWRDEARTLAFILATT